MKLVKKKNNKKNYGINLKQQLSIFLKQISETLEIAFDDLALIASNRTEPIE